MEILPLVHEAELPVESCREGLVVRQLVKLERHHGWVSWAHHLVAETAVVPDLQLLHLRDFLLGFCLGNHFV